MSFAEPNMLNPQVFLERRFRKFFSSVSSDETAFIRWKLEKELVKSGFKDVQITPFDWLHPSTPEPIIGAIMKAGQLLEKIPGIREISGSLFIRAYRS